MPRIDNGHEETEEVLKRIEKRISKEYKQAEEEIQRKLEEHMRKFKKKDALKRKALENGLITEEEYKQWRIGQLAMGQRWEDMKQTIAEDYSNRNQIARSIAFDSMPEVYAINHNYGTYLVEMGAHLDTSYTLYSRDAVEYLFSGGNFYPGPGRRVTARINQGLDVAWNKRQVQSVMMQGILQGESIGGIATRLAETVGESNRKSAIRNARTMATCVQNAGRIESFKRAEAMGIDLEQEWLATLDGRTRHEHRQADGQRVPVGKPFYIDGYALSEPGDPAAPGYLIYNCRCTVIAAVKGYTSDASDLSLRNTNHMGDMSYEEWKEGHGVSQSITHQDEVAETMRRVYGAEYNMYSRL